MLVWVVGVVRNDCVCKCWFCVYGEIPVSGCPVDGDVEIV
jgi:hypothetical protein